MAEAGEKLLQTQHRSEKAQARDRIKERKIRTCGLVQEGTILGRVLSKAQTIELSGLKGYLSRELGEQI